MTAAAPLHRCQVLPTPWSGIFGTRIDSARHYGRHSHDTFGFGLLEHGAQHSASGRGPVQAYAGDLITTNPGEVHDGRPLGTPTRRWRMVYLEPAAMGAMFGIEAARAALANPVLRDEALRCTLQQLFVRLDHWAAQRDAVAAMGCEEMLIEAGARLLRRPVAVSSTPADTGMARVRERLADERLSPPTLAELADMAGLSRYQLLRRFRRAYGLPPHAWLLQQRVEHARRLIQRGTALAEAAAASGFADQSHMTRLFMRHFGFTPGAWLRAARAQ